MNEATSYDAVIKSLQMLKWVQRLEGSVLIHEGVLLNADTLYNGRQIGGFVREVNALLSHYLNGNRPLSRALLGFNAGNVMIFNVSPFTLCLFFGKLEEAAMVESCGEEFLLKWEDSLHLDVGGGIKLPSLEVCDGIGEAMIPNPEVSIPPSGIPASVAAPVMMAEPIDLVVREGVFEAIAEGAPVPGSDSVLEILPPVPSPNPLYPRPSGGADGEGMRKQMPINYQLDPSITYFPPQTKLAINKAMSNTTESTNATESKPFQARQAQSNKRIETSGTQMDSAATYVGIDLGTNSTVVHGSAGSKGAIGLSFTIPTIVGRVPETSILGLFSDGSDWLVGDEAVDQYDHIDITRPLKDGVIENPESTRILLEEIHGRILKFNPGNPIYAVIGVPSRASDESRAAVAKAISGLFDKFILVPEPFLAALGFRDDFKARDKDYADPLKNCLIIDIGAGTTDLSLVQGRFPGPDDQISFPYGGDKIDTEIFSQILAMYPGFDLDISDIRAIKEANARCDGKMDMKANVIIKGKLKSLEVGAVIAKPVTELLNRIHEATCKMIEKSSSRMSAELVKNIYLTGGGSRIKFIDTALQERLVKDGYEEPRCRAVGSDYWKFVALGALKVAKGSKPGEWQSNL